MHVKAATIHGERPLRLHHVAIWLESTLVSQRERAALAWTEILTQIPAKGVPDEVYDRVRQEFSEKELSDLTFLVMSINAWNRVNVAFQITPGSYDKAFGIDGRSEEHTSELQSLMRNSYAVFCLKKKK